MTNDELHAEVERLFPGPKRCYTRSLVHALIDLEQVTHLNCTWSECVLPGVALEPAGIKRECATLDHTIAKNDGGTDHWTNITLMHHTCNMRKGAIFTEERRKKIGDAGRNRWQDPEYAKRVIENSHTATTTEEVRRRKSEAMKRHWADPERRKAHAAKLTRGDAWRKAREC